jgi:two-component system, sensor histidine kinase
MRKTLPLDPSEAPRPGFLRRARGFLRPEWLVFERTPHTVRGKLLRVVMITTLVALIIAGIAMLTSDLTAYRRSWASDLTTEADILALSTTPALAFDDRQLAEEDLTALRVRPGLRIAALYDGRGRLYAAYVAAGEMSPPAEIAPKRLALLSGNAQMLGERVDVFKRVERRGEWLGTVYLRARYSVIGRLQAYFGIFVLVTFGSLVLALVLSHRLQEAITEPLAAMARVARHVVHNRDYSLRAEKTSDDEVGIVVDAFNRMLDEVHARAEALREADRRKDEFLATLAHELRNPLAPIRQATTILESDRADERQRSWARQIISRQVQRMALLLDDLLDVSRITRGRLQLRKKSVDLTEIVSSAVEVAGPLIDAREHILEVHLPARPVSLQADPLRLSQALSNLLTNAAKYTDPHGRIVLAAVLQDDELRISVEDSGIGVSPQGVNRLFQPFTQLNAAGAHAEGGLGIGLALVKGLIELHGGTVEASSPGVGLGTTFIVHLPIARTDAAERGGEELPDIRPEANGEHRHVLVIDDNHDAADTLGDVLRITGHRVDVAYRGIDALEMAPRARPDVFIVDIGMPEMNGYELAKRIRMESWGERALLIALTGWGQPADKQSAMAAGFDHHFTKPVDLDELDRILAQFKGPIRSA